MSHELYKKHRPQDFDEMVGQDESVRILNSFCEKNKVPHAMILLGGTGVGKTTVVRILKKKLQCNDLDFHEINAADARGIDDIRELVRNSGYAASGKGKKRIFFIDECHQLTNQAQQILLKPLEDTPKHIHFILAASEKNKIIPAIMTRCTEINLRPIPNKDLEKLIGRVAKKEGINPAISDEVKSEIARVSEGSARKALVILEKVAQIKKDKNRLELIMKEDTKRKAYEIFQHLLYGKPWADIAAVIKAVDEEPESIRHLVLACATSVMIGPKDKKSFASQKLLARAYLIVRAFELNFFDSKKAGLVAACWDVCNGG